MPVSRIARCLLALILLLLLLTASRAYSQPLKVYLTVQQAKKAADAVTLLPKVLAENDSLRHEVDSLALAAKKYRHAADSSAQASAANYRAYRNEELAVVQQAHLTQIAYADRDMWRRKARRRGLFGWIKNAFIAYLSFK
jgi:hypothetical protein